VRMEGIAYVGEKRVAEAIVTCQVVDRGRAQGLPADVDGGATPGK
jgi:hypothetical protein